MGAEQRRLPERKDMNHLILVTFCLFGLLYGKHYLSETKNQDRTNSDDFALKNKAPKSFPCIPDNAKNKADLDKMLHEAAKYFIDNDKVIKSVTGSLPQKVTKETGGKFNSVITELMKEMKEKIKGMCSGSSGCQMVVKKSNNCMALDTETAKLTSFLLKTDEKEEDYFFGVGVGVGFVGFMAPVVGGIFGGIFG